MNSNALPNDKLIPIKLPEICAPRQELLRRFEKASDNRYIYVNAPGGCGKTVSTLLWMKKYDYIPIWLGLDAYDNTPAVFYRFFCSSLFAAIPQKESLSAIVMESAFSDSPVEYTIDILSRFSFDSRKYALVLDDFYFITNEEILKSLIYIVKRLPLSITVVFLSRRELPSFFMPLKENGRVAFIDASELAFKSDEIRRFFSNYGRFITSDEAEQAFTLTDGWAIAVSALALSGKITAEHKLDRGLLDEYIEKQIWSKLDDQLRLFLLETSIVDEFTVKLCERLTGNTDTKQILGMLCSGNMFISRGNDTYRYHHLFLEFLRREAEKASSIADAARYKIAADYYNEEEKYYDALRFYVRAEDKKGTADALYHFWIGAGKSSSELSRIAFITRLPITFLEQNPYLYVGCAWYALFYSGVDHFFSYLDKIYEKIQEIMVEYPMFLESMLFLFTIDHRYTFTEQKNKLPAAGSLSLDVYKISKSHCQHFPTYHRTHRDYSHYAKDTEEQFEEFRSIFSVMLDRYYPIIEAGVRAGLLYEQNRLKEALALVEPNPETDSDELIFLSKLHIASCLFAMGREVEAAQIRAEIKTILEMKNLLYLLPVFLAYETNIKLTDGDKTAATAWLENYFVIDRQDMELYKIYLHFSTVRAYIVLGEYKRAELLCEKLKSLSRDYGRLLDGIEATVLLILLKWRSGKKQEAVSLLQTALAYAEPYGFIRVFADEGKAILPALNMLRKKLTADEKAAPDYKYVHEIYQAAYDRAKRHKGMISALNKPIKLSKQQKSVLELLARGYRNAEIVELTGLSINTIRSHTKLVYQKLEVNSAIDAVLRARELELIE